MLAKSMDASFTGARPDSEAAGLSNICNLANRECPSGSALREARRQRGLSQIDLATLLRVSQSRVSAWECGYDEVPARVRHRIIDIMGNKRGVLDPLIANMIKNDPFLAVYQPILTDGLPDFKWLHMAPLPPLKFLADQSAYIGQRMSKFFDLGWCRNSASSKTRQDQLLVDVERDVRTNQNHGKHNLGRVRTQQICVEFIGHSKLVLARHSSVMPATGTEPKVHCQLFSHRLDCNR